MTTLTKAMARRYQTALQRYLKQGDRSKLAAARSIGSEFQAAGSDLKDLAQIHERTLVAKALLDSPASRRERIIRRSGDFYAAVITPIAKAEHDRSEAFISRGKLIEQLSHRTIELAVLNVERSLEITRRKVTEVALRQNEKHCRHLLAEANHLREHSRLLAQRLVSSQENERKKISHELHDVIAQTLMGINIHLATLKKEAFLNTEDLGRNIARTQELVIKSVDIVHQFARHLRPTVLDDLGLVPALQAFMKDLVQRNGLRLRLHAYADIDKLDVERRTTLFRVAQEALINVARHAHASGAEVRIVKTAGLVRMTIHDDGKAFQAQRVLRKPGRNHLGILGMRERIELLNGTFQVASARGQGTTITAEIPLEGNPLPDRRRSKPAATGTENA